MRHALVTSFQRSHALPPGVVPMSVAVYQPTGYAYPKVEWADIRDGAGQWTRPRNFLGEPDPLRLYRQALLDLYEDRLIAAREWAEGLDSSVALCCWCPYDKAAQRQLVTHGSFVCHTAVIAEFIEARLPSLRVWTDEDRLRMAVLPR